MTSLEYGTKCEKNKECPSNICSMKYKDGDAVGRYCLEGDNQKYTKLCEFPRDCLSNKCVKIYNDQNKFIGKRCLKGERKVKESSLDNLFGKTPPSRYGVNNEEYMNNKMASMGHAGPVTEIIIIVFNIIGDLFSVLIYNFRECSHDYDSQGLIYGLFMGIATGVYKALMGPYDGGLFWGGIQSKYYDSANNKCKANSRSFDMWYVRTIITILFPPLGVFMAKGLYGMGDIVMTCILTTLFYFPGLIYAFAVMSSSKVNVQEYILLRNFK